MNALTAARVPKRMGGNLFKEKKLNNKWIDVKTELPSPGQEVLVYGSSKSEIFEKSFDGTMIPYGSKERHHFWITVHFGGSELTDGDNRKILFWQPLPEAPNLTLAPNSAVEPQQSEEPEQEEKLKKMTLSDITIGELKSAMEYAQEMANGEQNPEFYAEEATALKIALHIISDELGEEYDECGWFWRRPWEYWHDLKRKRKQ